MPVGAGGGQDQRGENRGGVPARQLTWGPRLIVVDATLGPSPNCAPGGSWGFSVYGGKFGHFKCFSESECRTCILHPLQTGDRSLPRVQRLAWPRARAPAVARTPALRFCATRPCTLRHVAVTCELSGPFRAFGESREKIRKT
eukprot:scaffold21269_cov60-Phaeocystis_antarctica.AAC.4